MTARTDAARLTAAKAGLRRDHRTSRSTGEIRRARIGRSSTYRRKSSARAAAVAYRPAGFRAVALAN
jgi:hypothetical protein